MSHSKYPRRFASRTLFFALSALLTMSACTTMSSSSSMSVEDRIRNQKAEERAERREPPIISRLNMN